jgi:hypothetical protein
VLSLHSATAGKLPEWRRGGDGGEFRPGEDVEA